MESNTEDQKAGGQETAVGRNSDILSRITGRRFTLAEGLELMRQLFPRMTAEEPERDPAQVAMVEAVGRILFQREPDQSLGRQVNPAPLPEAKGVGESGVWSSADAQAALLGADPERVVDLVTWAWALIANVSNGEWGQQSVAWQMGAERWRDHYVRHQAQAREFRTLKEEGPLVVMDPVRLLEARSGVVEGARQAVLTASGQHDPAVVQAFAALASATAGVGFDEAVRLFTERREQGKEPR